MYRCDIIFWLVRLQRTNRVRHSNCVRHALQARRALGAEGHIRTACPRTACNNCLKMYVKVWHYSLQITIISQLFAWYIQSQHIYSNKTYSSNFWQHISNTKLILQKRTIPNTGLKETLSIYNHPPNVALFYPIAIYAHSFFWSSHQLMNYIFPLYIHILPTFTTM